MQRQRASVAVRTSGKSYQGRLAMKFKRGKTPCCGPRLTLLGTADLLKGSLFQGLFSAKAYAGIMNVLGAHRLRQAQKLHSATVSTPDEEPVVREQSSLSESAQKLQILESMVRHTPNVEAKNKMVAALSILPMEVLTRISDYGTKLEVYDKNAQELPLYAHHLKKPHLSGAYSPTANVLFVDQNNITPRILVHESMHALDMALGEPSAQKPWTTARDIARSTRKAIRPYATHNSAEYFADNLAASLFDKEQMVSLLSKDWLTGVGVSGLSRSHLDKDHSYYHREGQAQVDPLGSKLCDRFWQVLPKYGAAKPKPALTPAQYRAHLVKLHRARKGA